MKGKCETIWCTGRHDIWCNTKFRLN